MDNSLYANLTRQSGLMTEMQIIANNLANAQTTGFRAQGIAFSEFIAPTGAETESLSMAAARIGLTDFTPGTHSQTNAPLDLAIESDGFFLLQQADGRLALTRAGHFQINAEGLVTSPDGLPLLDAGQAPILLPATAGDIFISTDGTLSADGAPLAEIGLFLPQDPNALSRSAGASFQANEVIASPQTKIRQGYLEGSNVDSILQISRMIEVQRAYDLGQSFGDKEDERIRSVVHLLKG